MKQKKKKMETNKNQQVFWKDNENKTAHNYRGWLSGSSKNWGNFSHETLTKENLLSIIKQNKKFKDLSKDYGVHESTIRRTLKKYGLHKPIFRKHFYITNNGRTFIYIPNHPNSDKRGYEQKARLVMEEYLGRFLTIQEVVHHINRNQRDDRLENLQLFSNQKEHMTFHYKENIKRKENGTIEWKEKLPTCSFKLTYSAESPNYAEKLINEVENAG